MEDVFDVVGGKERQWQCLRNKLRTPWLEQLLLALSYQLGNHSL